MKFSISKKLTALPIDKHDYPWNPTERRLRKSTLDGGTLPRISIVIPSYNQGIFIEETILSIINQNYENTELIIIDGGSTDNTVEILKKYETQIDYWVSEPDQGQSHALNKGFSRTTGEIMAWICTDDVYLPDAFFNVAGFFLEKPDAEFVHGDGYSINEYSELGKNINSSTSPDLNNFHNYNYVFSTSVFWRRSLWERSGGYIDELNNWTMDWELFIRMSRQAELHYQPGKVACLRHHGNAKTFNGVRFHALERNLEIVKVSRKYGGLFCYNSCIYILLKIANISSLFKHAPKPIYSAMFWFLHLPIRFSGKGKKSMFFNGYRVR
jgi:glycosyltransferase involved in cell wall biosynthesis